ncbi:hypothetical protein K678_04111 [Magnetospirillum fulvum MGU-K5]|uniref:Uncharacterized protein n=1 Tax=Magnetospirillum fulvum MGU-K5 TaxID=1316936 RepID=S9TWG9_MAGFU|nr:hypothetical protein K678_04111 [Magnetospirillum fulvum MGU-K5]
MIRFLLEMKWLDHTKFWRAGGIERWTLPFQAMSKPILIHVDLGFRLRGIIILGAVTAIEPGGVSWFNRSR